MYDIVIILAVVMFGGCFALNDVYRKLRTSSFASSMESSFLGAMAGLAALLAISGFDFQATPFTCCAALLSALCGIGFMFCSLKALDTVDLFLYSLFSMRWKRNGKEKPTRQSLPHCHMANDSAFGVKCL